MLVEQLRKEWRAREHVMRIDHAPSFTDDGLVMGAGTMLVPAVTKRRLQRLEGHERRVLALLSAAYGHEVPTSVLGSIERAAKRWEKGEDCLASIHLALAGLSQPEDRREAARRLFMADGLIKAGIAPEAILQAVASDSRETFVRYVDTEARVPGGNGAASGEWTKTGGVLRDLTRGAEEFLKKAIAARLAASVRGIATNPYVLFAGMLLIPKTSNPQGGGDVPEILGLRYDWNRDEATLHLTYDGPNGQRSIEGNLGADGLFRDGDKIVARELADGSVAVDPAEVSSDLADKDGPNLCPKPEPDKPGRGDVLGATDKDYEDQIKLLTNPDNPTPRGYGYKFLDADRNAWVFIDDCQHQTGTRVEIKGSYGGLLTFSPAREKTIEAWLDQSFRQLSVSKGFPLTWTFARQRDADVAADQFKDAGKGRERINIITVPRAAAPQ